MNKHALHLMTWKEVEKAFEKDPVILVPLGSMEEHGPHSITGDYLAAEKIAEQVAINTNSYYIPVIPFGCSEYFRSYPGTISLSPQTVRGLLEDICVSLIEHGISKIIFVNGHAGNAPSIEEIGRKIRREHKIQIMAIDLWQSLTPQLKEEIYHVDSKDPSGHGGEPLTSVMLHLYPEQMRMDLLSNWENETTWGEFTLNFLSKVKVRDSLVSTFLNMEQISKEGIMGNPLNASSERGERILNYVVDLIEEMVKKLELTDTHIK